MAGPQWSNGLAAPYIRRRKMPIRKGAQGEGVLPMPELPEVETVRRGLEPWLKGATIDKVTLNGKDLRFPFPTGLKPALEGQIIGHVGRRAKYLLLELSGGRTLLSHLGMTGSWRVAEHPIDKPPRYYEP